MSIVKVLIVAKEFLIALDLKYRLQRLGYKTIFEDSNFQQTIEDTQPDLVLIDQRRVNSLIIGAIEVANLPTLCFNAEHQRFHIDVDLPCLTNPCEDTSLDRAIRETLRHHQTQIKLNQQSKQNCQQVELLHTINHELRTPLSTILIALDWLELIEQEELSARSLQKLNHLSFARNSISQMAEFLNRTALLDRCQSGKLSLKSTEINLFLFCKALIDEVNQQFIDADIEFVCASSDQIIFDEITLRQILINLLINAVKYSSSKVYLKLIRDFGQIQFQIRDQGIGILECDRESIFKPFYRGSNVDTIPGTGMGLAIVDQLVSACKGTIVVESALTVGSTFTVTLPI